MGETPKEKKKRIMARNKRIQIINLMSAEHERQAEEGALEAPRHDPEKARKADRDRKDGEEEQPWSAKVGEVRNRLTGKKRAATDRWNRFAGTGDGGGRGR